MTLKEQHISIISENPLNDTLYWSQAKLRSCNETDQALRDGIASLLSALLGSTTALNLPAPDGNGDVAMKLFSIQRIVRGGSVDIDHFRPLIRSVVDDAPDVVIWDAVFSLIDNLSTPTPPPSSIIPTYEGTPIKTSSSRLADSETRGIVEGELFFEIKDCTFRNVGGFCDKFFNSQSWREDQKKMLKGIMSAHNGKEWTDFPSTPDEIPVWTWLRSLEERFLIDAPYKLYTTHTTNQFKERKGQMDLFFQTRDREANNSTFTYKDVLVIGEQKKSYDTSRFKADILQLARYVRSVFADQPTRRFVHSFSLCSSKMELWIFDRSGPYSSGSFDIHDEPDKFARALVGYATMNDDAMGLDTFIEREEGYYYTTLEDTSNNKTKFRLEDLIVRQRAIVCRGTTCYQTRNSQVAKFSWVSDKRKPEVEQLKLAEERGVRGVARVVAHRRITTIAELREGLQFTKRHRFRDEAVHFGDLPSAAGSANMLGYKRKSSSDNTSNSTSGSKRRRSNSKKSKLSTELTDQLSTSKAKPSLYRPGEGLWENRIYSCLVVSPVGRVISDFRTIKELLQSMRDATRAHQDLYVTGKILHRDISSNNIIITKPEVADGFKGMLIDLDLAKVRESGPSGARHQTGTMQFMAVEVLREVDHTYRHDLESFFYVLLWMCVRESWTKETFSRGEKPPRESLLRRWEIGSFKYIAAAKAGDMAVVDGLEVIMGEFPEALDAVKPLCLKIRKILFPLDKDGRPSFGTPAGDPDQLYRPIIAAYDKAISEL